MVAADRASKVMIELKGISDFYLKMSIRLLFVDNAISDFRLLDKI
jgi:hypothetical protein